MLILIPMAGEGSRFSDLGYDAPKPLIDVNGLPMIQRVVESINLQEHPHVFIAQKKHLLSHPGLEDFLISLAPDVRVVTIDGLTDGAAETCLAAAHLINSQDSLLIVNSDQIVDWDSSDFIEYVSGEMDGCIVTFYSQEPRFSYALVEEGVVVRTAEKEVISDNATAGLYYWSKGCDFVSAARSMISKDIRFKNEYYVCPIYNENIADGQRITIYSKGKFHVVGTPEELNTYLEYLEF
jgi:NDP-sugar pyrophosphorylase family protein